MSAALPLRAALYLRVSTPRQAEHDVSIPDQRADRAKPIAQRAATNSSRPTWSPARPRPTIGVPTFRK